MDNDKELEVGEAIPENELTVSDALVDYKKHYTFADYMSWDDEPRVELINGEIHLMSSPTVQHQSILGNLYIEFANYLKGKTCKVWLAPFDVRLNMETTDDTVVQPDLVIICDKSIMMKTGCQAAPDMTIEILSPSTKDKDMGIKLELYKKTGVREYWIIDPELKKVIVYIFEIKDSIVRVYSENDIVPVHILDGLEINLKDIFEE